MVRGRGGIRTAPALCQAATLQVIFYLSGYALKNILSHEPVPRNRTLANAFVKLRLVESAGMGRRRIFIPPLSFGKPSPKFSADKKSVSLHLFNTGYSKDMAALISKLNQD